MEQNDLEKLKLIYPAILQEIHRQRDWQIKVTIFASGFYYGLIGLLSLHKIKIPSCNWAWIIFIASFIFYAYLLYVIKRCHENYLEARNVQNKIQKRLELDTWKVDNDYIFPREWFHTENVSICTRTWGPLFYFIYLTIICGFSILLIFGGYKFIYQ